MSIFLVCRSPLADKPLTVEAGVVDREERGTCVFSEARPAAVTARATLFVTSEVTA